MIRLQDYELILTQKEEPPIAYMINGVFYELDVKIIRETWLGNLIIILGYEIVLPYDDLEQDQKRQKIEESSYIMHYSNQNQIITLQKDMEYEHPMIEH